LEHRNQIYDMFGRFAFHRLLVIQIPFDDQLVVSIYMNVPRRVISLPPKKNKAAAPYFAHSQRVLPWMVTVVNRAIAVGSLGFVERVKSKLRSRAMHRTVEHELGAYALPNREEPYVAALRWLRID